MYTYTYMCIYISSTVSLGLQMLHGRSYLRLSAPEYSALFVCFEPERYGNPRKCNVNFFDPPCSLGTVLKLWQKRNETAGP